MSDNILKREATSKSKTPKTKAAQKEQTRHRVLQSVLDIIVSDGMRAVRHRAVALRAGVSLGTTTYHFSSIEDLIISAFGYWRTKVKLVDNPYYNQLRILLEPFEISTVPTDKKRKIAQGIYQISVGYVIDQIKEKREDRIIEFAFYHESILCPPLRDAMKSTWGLELGHLENVHLIMGSDKAKEDARITFTLFRQLEQAAILTGSLEINEEVIQGTLHRHMSLCFAEDFPK